MLVYEVVRVTVSLLLSLSSPSWAKDEASVRAVYVARGHTARLPCALTKTTQDPVVLVLWYKNGTKTPVFSVDSRGYGQGDWDAVTDASWARSRAAGASWAGTRTGDVSWTNTGTADASWAGTRTGDVFKGRASLEEERGSWTLLVHKTQLRDQGQYRCRLDFKSSPTHNAKVFLYVVDLPRQLRIFTPGGTLVGGVASAQESQPLTLSCRATAGRPLANVTWWSGATLLDAQAEEWLEVTTPPATPSATPPTSYVTNTLHVPALTRAHLSQTLTCRASNTPTLPPLTASLHLQEPKTRLSVHLGSPPGHMAGGQNYSMKCEASGVRPPPLLTWSLAGQPVTQGVATQRSLGSGSTVSELRVLASPAQDGALLQCRALAPTLPHLTASASTRITVHYVPEASISIQRSRGVGGSVGGLRAGDSATLTCATRANPPTNNITFMFNGRPLHRGQVVWNGPSSLTLLHLRYLDVGLYTCLASNTVGDGQSNAVALNIHYVPVCEWEGPREVLAAVGERVRLACRVQAAPPRVTFTWEGVTFTPDVGKERSALAHEDSGLTSVAWLVAGNVSSGGQLAQCQASNAVGPAQQPCLFTIVIVDEPSPLIGCHYHDVTTDSAEVTCSPGVTTGHLPQTYHIQVLEGEVVVASYNRSEPKFSVTSLSPGRGYLLVLYSSHARGRGPPTTLLLKTHPPKAQQVASESLSVNLEAVQEEETPTPAEEPTPGTPLSVVMAGVVVGVVMGVAVVVAVTVTCRARRADHHHAYMPSETHQHYRTSQDSLMETPVTAVYRSCSRHPSCELLTTFSPGPIVVTQVTPRRSFSRSSLPRRRASTLSTPGGRSPRPVRPRAFSCRGGPLHVLEVEVDDATNPRRAALCSPSSWTTLRGLKGGALRLQQDSDSSTSTLQTDPKFQSTPHVHLSPQCFLSSQGRCPSQPHMSPQGYDVRGLPQVRRRSQSQSLSHSYDMSPRVRRPSLSHSSTPSYDMADLLLRLRRPSLSRSSPQSYDITRLPQVRRASQTLTSPRSYYNVRDLPKVRRPSQPHSSPQRYNVTDLPLSHPQDQGATLPKGIPGIQVTPVAHNATLPHTTPQPLTTTHSPTMGFPHTDSQFPSPAWRGSPLLPSSPGRLSPSPHHGTTPQIKTHVSPPDTLSRLASQVHSTIRGHHQLEPHTITVIPYPQTPDIDLSSDNPPEVHPSTNTQLEGKHYTSLERSSIKLYPTFRSFEY